MTEACEAHELTLVGNGRGGARKYVLGDTGAKNVKRALESGGLCAKIARYQAVSNLVQMCP